MIQVKNDPLNDPLNDPTGKRSSFGTLMTGLMGMILSGHYHP
jgi:hypothetical protein